MSENLEGASAPVPTDEGIQDHSQEMDKLREELKAKADQLSTFETRVTGMQEDNNRY